MLQAADERRGAEHQQHVADDRPVSDALTRSVRPSRKRQRADDQLGGVAERRVEQAADAAAEPLGQRLGGPADLGGQRQDGEDRGREYGDVILRNQQFERDRERDEAEQERQPVAAEQGHR